MVNWPRSSPALTTFRAKGEGRAAQTSSNTRARACALVFKSDNRLPPKLINSLILLGFFTLIGVAITNLCTKTVQFSLFRPTLFCIVSHIDTQALERSLELTALERNSR